MPLWARCGVTGLGTNEGSRMDEEKEVECVGGGGSGGGGAGSFEGLVRNVASLLSDTVWGYFRPAQKPASFHSTEQPSSLNSPSGLPEEVSEDLLKTLEKEDSESVSSKAAGTPSTSPASTVEVTKFETAAEATNNAILDRADQIDESYLESRNKGCSNAADDIDEVLSSTLGALYGRATPAAVKQAWEVLNDSYGGDASRFKSEFLNPVLELLHRVQEIQDTGEFPNSTWPLSVGSSVVVHLSKTNCRYLRDIGDFCVNAVLDSLHNRPRIVVFNLTFDGIVERRVDEQEFGSLLTMDWARKVREASDHELVFVLRQCMVASEYTVRHLRWDEIPQLDPRNLRSALQEGNLDNENENSDPLTVSSLDAINPELGYEKAGHRSRPAHGIRDTKFQISDNWDGGSKNVVFLLDATLDVSSTDRLLLSHNLAVQRLVDDTSVIKDKHIHECAHVESPQLSHSHSFSLPSYPDPCSLSPDLAHDSSIPLDISGRTDLNVDQRTDLNADQQNAHLLQLSSSEQGYAAVAQPIQHERTQSSPLAAISGTSYTPLSASAPSASFFSGAGYCGTWHGPSKGLRSQKKVGYASGGRLGSSGSDSGGICHNVHIASAPGGPHREGIVGSRDAGPIVEICSMEQSTTSSTLTHRKLDAPDLISQVDCEVLSSGVAILPGCLDEDGRYVMYIFTCSSLWHERRVSSTELARLLMYYYSLPRRKKCNKDSMAIVADIRGATPSIINILLEALNLFQDNIPGSVAIVHLFADRSTQSYVIKSPLYDAKANVNLKVVLTFDHLQQYINASQIPTVLDGDYPYNHESWVRFRKKLEPFMFSCRTVACRLVDTMREISSGVQMPQSVLETSEMIHIHEQAVKLAFEDEKLLSLQSDGPAIISALKREEQACAHCEDYSFAMDQATELYQNLLDTITRLAILADEHMTRLHNCLQLREYEDECHKVVDWLSQDGETILQKHATTADNLKAVRHQQKDFDKFYYSAVSYIEKGNDLLEEASMLSQCGSFSEATGYKDLARTLRRQLQSFTGQLEEARERIEGTAKCYHLLDKSYEWALEAMKYVSSMKMEHSTTAEGLDKLLRSLSIYLSEHPVIPEESFADMLEAAQKLNNDRLLEQCRLAKARCQETQKLLQLRHATLSRARSQMGVEQVHKDHRGDKTQHSAVNAQNLDTALASPSQIVKNNNNRELVGVSFDNYGHSSGVFLTPLSIKKSVSAIKAERGDGTHHNISWVPQDSSTPTFSDCQGAGDGHRSHVSVGFKSKNSSCHSICSSSDEPLRFQSSPCPPGQSCKSSPSTSPSKISISSSFSSPLPSSSSEYAPTSISLPVSPTLSASEIPIRTRLYQPSSSISRVYNSPSTRISTSSGTAKPIVRRPISHPQQPSAYSHMTGVTPTTRPHKKILKRASTAPIPMLTSPILEEEAGPFGHPSVVPENSGNEADVVGSRDQRNTKSVSVITSSTESLPSMPEEEETDLDMSPGLDPQELGSGGSVKDWTPVPVNTHLHRSASRGTPTGPMADLRLSEAEMKSRRTVSLIMSEMIQTERDYVRALQFITDHYVPELQRDDVPQMLRGKRTVIFGNLEKIHQFHSQYFLKQLESCQNQPFLVGQYFLQHETMFYLYALYNKNKPKSDSLMTEYGKEFFRQKQLELGDKMDLSSYLLKPVQRMGKYALLLKQLLKECSETELEYPELKAAEEMVKFQLRHGNDLLAMDSLRDCDVNLQEQGRLLRQEEFLVFQGRKKSMRRIFLFEDLILFSKTRRGRQGQHDIYIYKTSFKTADIGLTENFGDSGYKFEIWFRRRSVGENYVLQAPSSEVKKAWVKDISRLLWRQAIRNRESRINELATMGIGNKPCLDIKPSEDNIQDRSINVSLGHRGARTRNSIAVSSFDYLRNGNKRPHSIISVSSTSSSGSSQSSFGLLGSLNLAFDPLDSPRMNRRSFLSNESGIATDSDASGGDLGLENRGPTPGRPGQQMSVAPQSSMRSYFDVMKSRVLKQKYSDQLFTDV